MRSDSLIIPAQFRGPIESGNGGYVCGRLASYLPGCAAVRLKAPPPLQTELRVEASDSEARLLHESRVIAEAQGAELELSPPARPSFAEAREAAKSYAGFTRHPFPQCFVCGPERAAGDGLRIFPGPIGSDGIVASPWIPDMALANDSGRIHQEYLWAALDCPGYFAVMPMLESGTAAVLGELCARIDAAVEPNANYVVTGWLLGHEGRKRYAGSAILSATGHAVAMAKATWIGIPGSTFGSE